MEQIIGARINPNVDAKAWKKFTLASSDSMAAKDLFNKVTEKIESGLRRNYPALGATSRTALSGEYAGESRTMHVANNTVESAHLPLILASVSFSYADNSVKLSYRGSEMAEKDAPALKIVGEIVSQYNGKEIVEQG